MKAYICTVCSFLYDDESAHIGPDGKQVPFEELDIEWTCPSCGIKAELFKPTDSIRTKDVSEKPDELEEIKDELENPEEEEPKS